MAEDYKPHLFVKNIHTRQKFKVPPQNRGDLKDTLPERNRVLHGAHILSQLNKVWKSYKEEKKDQERKKLPSKNGEYITFKSAEENILNIESLDSSGTQLLNVKCDKDSLQQVATVYIPSNKKEGLISKIQKYSNLKKKERFNENLVARIENISKSDVINLWYSPSDFIPKEKAIWCELWISGGKELYEEVKSNLNEICILFDIHIGEREIFFPQRTIINVKVNFKQLDELVKSFDYIAEIRKSEELNSFWLDQKTVDRENFINDALSKINFNKKNNFISIMDTGVNNGHALIEPVLDDENKLTINQNWGVNGAGGHGTGMAGVAVYGDLNSILENNRLVEINHQLESIKIIPPENQNEDKKLPAIKTENAVNISTINNPSLKRIYCFANTGTNQFEFGKPTTWSSVIDKMIFGVDNNNKKLFVVSVGNVRQKDDYNSYPESNLNLQIESPAQSWNSISVGAFTGKLLSSDDTLAGKNELSPFSRTSVAWENNWPIKPDIVFEGGNLLKDSNLHVDLEILTTSNIAIVNKLTTIYATSAATAFASNFLAKLRNAYPDAWEETLRGLTIHSASWTKEMKSQLNFDSSQKSIIKMLRTFGYGVPNLKKALECQSNYLTFISEQSIQPYIKKDGEIPATNDVHFYKFPWPKDILNQLGDKDVTIRITLSYFIEPNPGEKGYSTKYSYQSTALKFALMPPNDEPKNFMLRINNAAREELKIDLGLKGDEKLPDNTINKVKNVKWELGAENVFKGSIHSNYWKTSAAEAAACNYIAVYPQPSGWWKNLKKQEKYNEKLRYSLIVSLETPENTSDIYTKIAEQVKIENLVKV